MSCHGAWQTCSMMDGYKDRQPDIHCTKRGRRQTSMLHNKRNGTRNWNLNTRCNTRWTRITSGLHVQFVKSNSVSHTIRQDLFKNNINLVPLISAAYYIILHHLIIFMHYFLSWKSDLKVNWNKVSCKGIQWRCCLRLRIDEHIHQIS